MFKRILMRVAHELEQGLTLVLNDLVYGKKARKGRKWAAYKAPKTPKASQAHRTTYSAYSGSTTPRMVVVNVQAGAHVHL